MNIDERINAKVESIEGKIKEGKDLDLGKLQSCSKEMCQMMPAGASGAVVCSTGIENETLKSGVLIIEKLILLKVLNLVEKAFTD